MHHTADSAINHFGIVDIINVVILDEVDGAEESGNVGGAPYIQFQKEANADNRHD